MHTTPKYTTVHNKIREKEYDQSATCLLKVVEAHTLFAKKFDALRTIYIKKQSKINIPFKHHIK